MSLRSRATPHMAKLPLCQEVAHRPEGCLASEKDNGRPVWNPDAIDALTAERHPTENS